MFQVITIQTKLATITYDNNLTFNIITPYIPLTSSELVKIIKRYYYGYYELEEISDTTIELSYMFKSSASDFHYARDKVILEINEKLLNKQKINETHHK